MFREKGMYIVFFDTQKNEMEVTTVLHGFTAVHIPAQKLLRHRH